MKSIAKLMTLSVLALSMAACAPEAGRSPAAVQANAQSRTWSSPGPNPEVTLRTRYHGGGYLDATYSFKYLTQGALEKTHNNFELMFEDQRDHTGATVAHTFEVNTVVDDNSYIYDLGEKSCQSIKSAYPDDRSKRPLVWLAYSEADPSELTPAKSVAVKVGHCYLTYNNDEDGRVVALFHVKSMELGKSVTLNEIEVLDVTLKD